MAKRPDQTEAKSHGLADHQYGDALTHRHDAQSDHDHDDFEDSGPLEENPLWIQDHVTLTSVGIDIGSPRAQGIFSQNNLRPLAEDLTPPHFVGARGTLFLSPPSFAPPPNKTPLPEPPPKPITGAAPPPP